MKTVLKLIQLEFKKVRFSGYIRGIIIANVLIALFVTGITFLEQLEGIYAFQTYEEAFSLINVLVQVTFVVFAAVLIARLVIEEYKHKTITVMFSYPIQRKKLFAAKLIIVFFFTFVTILLSNAFVTTAFFFLSEHFSLVPDQLSHYLLIDHAKSLLISTATSSGISLAPVYFGMLKKSVPTTIVSGLLLIAIVTSNNNGFSLSSITIIPVTLACIGILLAYLTFRNIEEADVL
ncbi:ABC transporter permease [Halalkalibacterium halodurans]|uniref:ABC transporter permease n=1 Tax=Halalkalibacterium halodurans TaxID=86665 RepID=UPI00399D16CC